VDLLLAHGLACARAILQAMRSLTGRAQLRVQDFATLVATEPPRGNVEVVTDDDKIKQLQAQLEAGKAAAKAGFKPLSKVVKVTIN
jgi:hypothetical protein